MEHLHPRFNFWPAHRSGPSGSLQRSLGVSSITVKVIASRDTGVLSVPHCISDGLPHRRDVDRHLWRVQDTAICRLVNELERRLCGIALADTVSGVDCKRNPYYGSLVHELKTMTLTLNRLEIA